MSTSTQGMSKGGKVAIFGIVAAALILVVVLLTKKLSASEASGAPDRSSSGSGGSITTIDPVTLTPVKTTGPDPSAPVDYTMGQYHRVRSGDTMIGILKEAGFTGAQVNAAYKVMLKHARNEWIGTVTVNGWKLLRFYKRFQANAGAAERTWAHDTKWMSSSTHKWPLVYVPSLAEVEG